MPYNARIKELEKLHSQINHDIDLMEQKHPHVDEVNVHNMKKIRLRYLDELSKLRRLQYVEDYEHGSHYEDDH